MSLCVHEQIETKLKYFHEAKKIPNIIFHGSSGVGKRTIVHHFIEMIYEGDKQKIKDFVMYVNCAHGKGIKFIREDLKFFAKTNINSINGDLFKSIILLNADKLTIDAQSALRRCIELFSHNTRFFIIVEDKYKLLKPILSRFCEFFIPEPMVKGRYINLHKHSTEVDAPRATNSHEDWLKKCLQTLGVTISQEADPLVKHTGLVKCASILYEKGYSGINILNLIEKTVFLPEMDFEKRVSLLFAFSKIKKEFRNEKLLMLFILKWVFISSDVSLENISFM
jgi:hypothetical protein